MILKLPSEIQNPPQGSIAIFRNANAKGIVYYMTSDGYNYPVPYGQDIYRISPILLTTEPINYTGQRLNQLKYDGKEFLFSLSYEQVIQRVAVGGGGNSGAIKGLIVQDEGVQVNGLIQIENFIGDLVNVTSPIAGKANITIVIPSFTTAQRLAFTPAAALVVEDTDLDMYFKWSTVTSSWSPF